ncbi:hypothetical protein [Fibrobacter sp.]|uniref:hypothetical protein n=1 Tax=Fibrobacter sp. TaxID=35828 RepID=UPI00386F2D7C
MTKRSNITILNLAFLITLFVSCSYTERNKKNGNEIIRRIEDYRTAYDTLPCSLMEMGQEEIIDDVLFCYEKVDSVHYMVWFGTTLGEGVYFYSDTKKWEDRLRKIGE